MTHKTKKRTIRNDGETIMINNRMTLKLHKNGLFLAGTWGKDRLKILRLHSGIRMDGR
jgi:hypothetical protein